MCDEAINDSLAAFKLIPDCFLSSKIIKNHLTARYADEHILYFIEDSNNFVFNCNEIGIFNIINLDNNF